MRNLKLTDSERFILANQYDILALLNKDENYSLMAETLRDGHVWLYQEYFDTLSENLSDHKSDHVLSILGIYGDIKCSFDQLVDKSGIKESSLIFPGFDGNNESELLSFAQALRKHNRFSITLGDTAKNSHMPTTEMYERMIQKWDELGKPHFPYSREQIIAILDAQIHPENRK